MANDLTDVRVTRGRPSAVNFPSLGNQAHS